MQMILQRRCVGGCNVVLIIAAVIGVVRGLFGYVGYVRWCVDSSLLNVYGPHYT